MAWFLGARPSRPHLLVCRAKPVAETAALHKDSPTKFFRAPAHFQAIHFRTDASSGVFLMPTGHASLMPALRRVVLVGTSAERTDGQLLGAFVTDRDADAFGQLVRRHGPMVIRQAI